MPKICEVCSSGEHDPTDHPFIPVMEEGKTALSIAGIGETENPLNIAGIHEVNMNPKDPDNVDEGGLGSGREPGAGGEPSGSQPGPLISFGQETIPKTLMDAKLKESCPCHKNSK